MPNGHNALRMWFYPTGYSICIVSKDFLWLYVLSKMNTYVWYKAVERMIIPNDPIWPLQCLWSCSRRYNKNIIEL